MTPQVLLTSQVTQSRDCFLTPTKVRLESSCVLTDADFEPIASALFDTNSPGDSVLSFLSACIGREAVDRDTFTLILVFRDGHASRTGMITINGEHLIVKFRKTSRKEKRNFSLSYLLEKAVNNSVMLPALTHIIVQADPWHGDACVVTAIKQNFWLAPQPDIWAIEPRFPVQYTSANIPDASTFFFSCEEGLAFEFIIRPYSDPEAFRVNSLNSEELLFPDYGPVTSKSRPASDGGLFSLRELLLNDTAYEEFIIRNQTQKRVLARGQPVPHRLVECNSLVPIQEISSHFVSEDMGEFEVDFLIGLGIDPVTKFARDPAETNEAVVSKLWAEISATVHHTSLEILRSVRAVEDESACPKSESYGSIYTQWDLLPPESQYIEPRPAYE